MTHPESRSVINVAEALRGPWLTINNRAHLRATVLDALVSGTRNIVLDLDETTFIDSSGLGVLIGLQAQARKDFRAELCLARVSEELRALLATMKVDGLLPVKDHLLFDGPSRDIHAGPGITTPAQGHG